VWSSVGSTSVACWPFPGTDVVIGSGNRRAATLGGSK
jgi:hypothetical protein